MAGMWQPTSEDKDLLYNKSPIGSCYVKKQVLQILNSKRQEIFSGSESRAACY
ncbi:conserved hypothetical protein [Ricinus communis]|uniref:Uncharacterized protein n=1 Tax=Ricinus communis TaxID=3988 RepID=B9S8X1_RICCO|nr:conserved hypothetical protein [Ricinus communis]